jgi:hypothetical protein
MTPLVLWLAAAAASPSTIVGTWRTSCPENEGMLVEMTLDGKKAVGRVVETGAAKKYGYVKGEEMFRLNWDPHGDWLGEVRWRGVSGAQHWDSIRMQVQGDVLRATMTNDGCYKNMTRAK